MVDPEKKSFIDPKKTYLPTTLLWAAVGLAVYGTSSMKDIMHVVDSNQVGIQEVKASIQKLMMDQISVNASVISLNERLKRLERGK